MSDLKHADPQIPSLNSMAIFATLLGVALITLVLMLHFKFTGQPPA